MIRGSLMGNRFRDCSFDNYEVDDFNRQAFDVCREIAQTGEYGVLIMGKHGLGKTHLLISLAKEYDRMHSHIPAKRPSHEGIRLVPSAKDLIDNASQHIDDPNAIPSLSQNEIERQAHVEYWPLLDLTSELRSDIARGSQEISTRCRKCDLLILDDFGAERVTDFVLEELERIVDWRYRQMTPTAIATNLLTFEEITNKYGQRAFSRWMGSCYALKVGGQDRRATTGPMIGE